MTRGIVPWALAFLVCLAALPARAEYALANLRFTLYHELGHAVIDQAGVPMFASEEDAADGFAILLAHLLHEEEAMVALIVGLTHHGQAEAAGELFDHWGPYMPGGQRTARAVCLWYGLRPLHRLELARALGMPSARAPFCEMEASALHAAWRPILARLRPEPGEEGQLMARGEGKALRVLARDIERINAVIDLPKPTPVTIERCGEENAFYYHDADAIVFCEEMTEGLYRREGR